MTFLKYYSLEYKHRPLALYQAVPNLIGKSGMRTQGFQNLGPRQPRASVNSRLECVILVIFINNETVGAIIKNFYLNFYLKIINSIRLSWHLHLKKQLRLTRTTLTHLTRVVIARALKYNIDPFAQSAQRFDANSGMHFPKKVAWLRCQLLRVPTNWDIWRRFTSKHHRSQK